MPRSRFTTGGSHPTVFLNRTEQLHLITSHVALLSADPDHLKVFEIVGMGGVGKTRLLNELQGRVAAGHRTTHLLWVSLEGESSATETGPLRVIREQFHFECLLFDTALLTYWNATGQPFEVPPSSRLARSLVFKSLDVGRGMAGIPLPLTFAVDVFHAIVRKAAKLRHYREEEFEAIDSLRLDPSAIRERLPHYLGLDASRRLSPAGQTLVGFYDAYDRQTPTTVSAGAPWLREFIATIDRGVHIIATRDPIRWRDPDWQAIVQGVVVSELPDRESRELIRARLGTIAPELEDRLVQASRRIPFFLAAALDAYEMRSAEDRPINVNELPDSPDAAVAYLLNHLAPDQRTIAIALATVQVFDLGLYSHLIRALNLPLSVLLFDEFIDWFFVEELSPGLYKTHDLFTAFVRESTAHASLKQATLETATMDLLGRCGEASTAPPQTVLPLFTALLAAWRSVSTIPERSVETLVDAGYVLYDLGYWHELAAMADALRAAPDHPVSVVTDFFAALAARRTRGIPTALERFERLEPRVGCLGRHRRSVELELAYLSELSGNYARAREQFRALERLAAPFDPTNRTHLRSRLYHADMLINDGAFEPAARLLLETYEVVGYRAPLDWAELVRHRAHAFRYSLLLDVAEDLYLKAQGAALEAPALSGSSRRTSRRRCAGQTLTARFRPRAWRSRSTSALGTGSSWPSAMPPARSRWPSSASSPPHATSPLVHS